MSTDLTFVTNEPGNNLRQESVYIFNPRKMILSSDLVNAETSRTHHTSNLMLLTDGVQHRVLREPDRSRPVEDA